MEGSLCPLDVVAPALGKVELVDNEILSDQVEPVHISLHVLVSDHVLWELFNRSVKFGKQMPSPNNLSCLRRHVSDDWGSGLVLIESLDDSFNLRAVVLENSLVFALKFVLDSVGVKDLFQFLKQLKRV